jgi:ABC-2 type transport system ATP-binding protein
MIQVENLTKFYGPKPAIRDISFEVKKGEILGLLGPNGAGKTTTMRILTGYMPPTSGKATVAGFEVTEQSIQVRRHLGYLPEHVPLYTDMAVREFLSFAAKIHGVPSKKVRSRVDEVMELCWVADRADVQIIKLSRGYRQRVGLAQALVHDPPVLILDEPTVGLDPKQIVQTRKLIKSLAGRRSVILSTHILPEVSMTCSRVVIINNGTVVAEDTPENLTRRLRGADAIILEVRGNRREVLAALQTIPRVLRIDSRNHETNPTTVFNVEVEPGSDLRETLAQTVVSNGWGLLELRPQSMSLEDIFVKLTTREESIEA